MLRVRFEAFIHEYGWRVLAGYVALCIVTTTGLYCWFGGLITAFCCLQKRWTYKDRLKSDISHGYFLQHERINKLRYFGGE